MDIASYGLVLLSVLNDVSHASHVSPTGGPFAGLENARRPARIEQFWLGLGPAGSHAPASGIVVLRSEI